MPMIEVSGRSVFNVLEGFGPFRNQASNFLLRWGIGRRGADGLVVIDADGWYPYEPYINAFAAIGREVGRNVLVQCGRAVPKHAVWPAELDSIEKGLQSIDVAYHLNHRKDGRTMFDPRTGSMMNGIGHYRCSDPIGQMTMSIESDTPYPSDFDLGIISAIATKFEPLAKVRADDTRTSRLLGARSCTYVVSWGR